MKSNYSILLILILVPILMLTACGGGDTTTTVTQTATTTTTATVATTATATVTATQTTTATPPTVTVTATVTQTVTPTQEPTPTETQEPEPEVFTLTSTAFENGEPIPMIYSYLGGNKSPQLSWSHAPEGTVSFVILVDDPDAPSGSFSHWVVFDIPSDVFEMAEAQPITATLPNGAKQGMNDFGTNGYDGPAPPAGTIHRYFFKIYALDTMLNLSVVSTDYQVINAMQGHILGEAEYMGTYGA